VLANSFGRVFLANYELIFIQVITGGAYQGLGGLGPQYLAKKVRGQWFVEPNAATRVHCVLGCARQSSVASARCSCLAAEKEA
jgi:hypothetical protein